jgi:hypothetical protein
MLDGVHGTPLNLKFYTLYYAVPNFRESESFMKIKVESYSDSKGQESPTRFMLGTRTIEVESCVDRWYGEQACYFRVLGNDENSYILKGPLEDGSWELVSFTHKDSRGTELEYEGKRELQ